MKNPTDLNSLPRWSVKTTYQLSPQSGPGVVENSENLQVEPDPGVREV